MPERDRLVVLAARFAHGRPIDWDREESAAASEADREGIRKLRQVAALSLLHRAVMSSAAGDDLGASVLRARDLAGRAPDTAAPALALGSRFGPLEVLERVGGGAFGEVYRARDPRLDREVALKIVAQDRADPPADVDEADEVDAAAAVDAEEVVREARLLARVRHPNVVTVHGADRIAGRVGIWTEFLRGETLDRVLAERGRLDGREAVAIALDLCRGLAAVHAAGIIHQDVKLANVMRTADGRVVIMDFGLGREIEPHPPRARRWRHLSGTPLFMAPEVLAGGRPDARADLYSLGVVLFSLVTGSLPVSAATLEELKRKHARGETKRVRDLRPDLSPALHEIIDRALSPDPERRYQAASDVERDLLAYREGMSDVPQRLPAETDAFVGREEELAAIVARFGAGARLVTLLGPGGIGKTRLAIRHAWRSRAEWPGGTWFSDLTEARTKDGIASAVGAALGVSIAAGDAVEQLGHTIAARGRCLLILDNCEQVVRAVAETVALWLARAPAAQFLVTSRERLKIPGEEVQAIEPLPLERGVELFLERARRQRPIVPAGPETAAVREVVRLLEGIPLAIELAAARLRVLTPAQIVERIAERFRLLAGSGAGRHATLGAAIDSSWELLAPWEKAALAQCAVFEGGFTLEAAEGVLDLTAWPAAPWMVDVLQSLVDKSLLRSSLTAPDRGGARPAMRFGMLVSLQEYAREKLGAEGSIPASIPAEASGSGAARAAEQRHGRWFARHGDDEAIEALDRQGGVEKRQALIAELDNLVAGCRRMAAAGESEAAVRNYRAIWAVLELRGPFAAAIDLGTQLLQVPLAPALRARLLQVLGHARQRSGRIAEARADFEAALAGARECGDRRSEGRTLALLATLPLNEGRIGEAVTELTAALAILREVGDRRAEGIALGNLGLAHHEDGALDAASDRLEAALAIHREIGNRRSEGIVLGNLGNLRREQGRLDEARVHFESALAIHREVGNRRFEGILLGNLGSLCREQGRMGEARVHFEDAIAIHREVGARRFEGEALDNLGGLALTVGRAEEAFRCFESSLAIHREVGNRRAEGIVLGNLGALRLVEGRPEAGDLIAEGESVLRSAGYQVELAKLLCTRAEMEIKAGGASAAQRTMAEAEAIAAETGARPDSELGRRLRKLREALPDQPPG